MAFKRRAVAGKPKPTVFQGERMYCALCSQQQQSDPAINTQWRALELEGQRYYVCPVHFPADDAGEEAFQAAYQDVIVRLIEKRKASRNN